MSAIKDGGPAYPMFIPENHFSTGSQDNQGMSLRDWFAGQAPESPKDWLDSQHNCDRQRNPHNDSYKPAIRSDLELRASWRWAYADAMIKARETAA